MVRSWAIHCDTSLRGNTMVFEFNGKPPAIEGRICEGFICQGYEFKGELIATANVTYLKFGGIWHSLSFDPGTVHWRIWPTQPEPWAVDEEGWNYPQVDVGASGLIGVELKSYKTLSRERGAGVLFEFENGREVLIESIDDITSYQVR